MTPYEEWEERNKAAQHLYVEYLKLHYKAQEIEDEANVVLRERNRLLHQAELDYVQAI